MKLPSNIKQDAKPDADEAAVEAICRAWYPQWDRWMETAIDDHHGELSDGEIAIKERARAVLASRRAETSTGKESKDIMARVHRAAAEISLEEDAILKEKDDQIAALAARVAELERQNEALKAKYDEAATTALERAEKYSALVDAQIQTRADADALAEALRCAVRARVVPGAWDGALLKQIDAALAAHDARRAGK